MKKIIVLIILVLFLAACARGPAPKGSPTLDTQAATISVTTFADESDFIANGKCSLREAIISANNNANYGGCIASGTYTTTAPDIITLLTGTYTLTRGNGLGLSEQDWGDLDISSNLNIVGAGATSTIIQG